MKPFIRTLKALSKKCRFKKLFRFFLLFLVRAYRTFLSPHFGGACRFVPSCSHYAEQILEKPNTSLPSSLKQILCRLKKCHFFGPFGVDEPFHCFIEEKQ